MRTLATIAFSASGALLLAALLPRGTWSLLLAAGLLLLGGLSLVLMKKKQRLRAYATLIAFSAAAGLLYSAGYQRVLVAPVLERCGEGTTLTVEVTDYPQVRENGWRITVRPEGWRVKASLYTSAEGAGQLEPGQKITCTVHIQDASSIGGDDVTIFTARGVFALLYDRGDGLSVEDGRRGSLRYFPLRLKQAVLEKIPQIWQDQLTAGLLQAELLGDKSGLTDAENDQVSEVGLSHLFAVSGLHCAFLVSLLGLLIPAGRQRLLAGCAIPLLVVYMVAVGMTPSVVRACIMLVFLLIAPLFRRATDPLTALSSALLVILLSNPYAAASVSLQLSFGATLGLLVVSPRIQKAFSRRCQGKTPAARKVLLFLGANLSATLGAMVFTTPLTAYYFGTLTPLSPLSNLLAVPLAGWSFMAAFITLPVGFLYLPTARILGLAARGLTAAFWWLVELMLRVPGHVLYLSNPYLVYWLGLVYAMGLVCVLSRQRGRKYVLALALSIVTLAAAVGLHTASFRAGALTAVAVDVGQGESVVLSSEGHTMVVDCGSSNSYKKPARQVLAQLSTMGVQRLDAVAVTHYHADHTNGLYELLERVEVDTVYLPDIEDEYGVRERLAALAEEKGCRIVWVREQTTVALGECGVTVYPPVGQGDLNEQGLSFLCTTGDFDLLITGDMSGSTEEALAQTYPLPDVEVLLVSHHGSKYSSSRVFLEDIQPETAIISVGDNTYGHPTPAAMARLAAAGATLYRTDQEGSVTVRVG